MARSCGIFLYSFRKEFAALLGRLREISGPAGLSGKFDSALNELEVAAQNASAAVDLEAASSAQDEDLPTSVRKVLEEAASSPRAALMLLAAEIEREVRDIAATRGELDTHRGNLRLLGDPAELLRVLDVPPDLVDAYREFRSIRNRIVHGREATDDEVLRAIDSGLKILDALNRVPRENHFVHRSGIEIYEDADGRSRRDDVNGVMLRSESTEGGPETIRVFPTTRDGYQEGEPVSWEWNRHGVWGESWYRDPDTREVKYAWTGSVEFVGRHLSDL